ncbi:MAG: hypothetical protein J7M08_03085 [Planctomycetes bacterium]|nr:hypothetical protein [Planctomycetota bacterium]
MDDSLAAPLKNLLSEGALTAPLAADLIRRDPATKVLLGLGYKPDPGWRAGALRRTAGLCPSLPLTVAGHAVQARLSLEELWRFYLPLARLIRGPTGSGARRRLVGVTGPGAAGKSVFALLMAEILARLGGDGAAPAALCPLDGFHYPNDWLESHYTVDELGRRVSLQRIKGAPASFDVESFVSALRRLRSEPTVLLPRYDRRLHNPVADSIRVAPGQRIVLVEGNYLLLGSGEWAAVRELLDLRLLITAPPGRLRVAMIARHVAGGRPPQDARRHYEQVDRRNREIILETAPRADLLLVRDDDGRLREVQLPQQTC